MKKLYVLLVAVTMFAMQTAFARTNNNPTVQEQLENLNKYWKNKSFIDPILQERIPLNSDVPLIQMHLSLVEQKLRDKNISDLSTEQQQNRNKCLAILHNYWTRGIFPKNLYHKLRTPYFIDKFGTACAVGQLIISTGYETFAERISFENNNAYIEELNKKYSEIKIWADKYGFTIDELAWIQPGYAICDTSCNLAAQISVTSGTPPYSYLWNPSGQTSSTAIGLCPASTYSCSVIDVLGDTVPPVNCVIYFSTQISNGTNILIIPAASPLYTNLTFTDDNGSCNGTATVNVITGTSPYSFYWSPSGQTTQTATGLCQGTHQVFVLDANLCFKNDSVVVNSSVGINETNKENNVYLFPNPSLGIVTINTSKLIMSGKIFITNILGESVFEEKYFNELKKEINLKNVSQGIYFVKVFDGEKSYCKKLIVEHD